MKTPKLTLYVDDVHVCTGRMIGLISREECRAVINTPDAGKKIYTSEAIDIDTFRGSCQGCRFVIATDDFLTKTYERSVFISPVIRYMSYVDNDRNFRCEDGREYSMKRHRIL